MSSSGSGRGRGWLNLAKNAETPRPVGLSRPLMNNSPPLPPPTTEHKELMDRIKELNVSDDGIMFNKKMQHIQSYWTQICNNKEDVERSFEYIYNVCLHDPELGSKLVTLVSSRTFITKEINSCNLRHQFLKHLQKDFENSNQLHTTNPSTYRNCIHMLGEFYSKGRLLNGEPYKFLATPFVSCLELLLDSKSLPELILFTTQLFLNGSTLRKIESDGLLKIMIKIRTILVSETQLVKDAKLWLLLALDLYDAKFTILPPEIFKFYEDHLGSTAMINFQRPHEILSIQTLHSSKVLDSYQSNVNVLQISTSPTETAQNEIHMSQFSNTADCDNTHPQSNTCSKDVPGNKKEKTGRPILGVGARFIKNKSNDENDTWNNKQNSTSSRAHNKKMPPSLKNNKGWEHDDRFENDYN